MNLQDIRERLMGLIDCFSSVEEELELQAIVKEAKAAGFACHIRFLRKDLAAMRKAQQENATNEAKTEIEKEVEAMNAEFFVTATSSKVRVGRLTKQFLNGHSFFDHHEYSSDDFKLLFKNKEVAGKSVADWWLESPSRRLITGSFMSERHPPNAIVNGRINLWQGLGVEPAPGDWQWFTTHVQRLLRKDPEAVGYVIRWLAWCVQNPTRPIGTMVMLIGDEGAGKGAIGNVMRSIFGPHGIVVENRDQIVGRFNGGMRNACFVFVDEALFAGSKADADRLKHLITEPTITVERKFRDGEEVDNRLKLFAVTNHEHAVAMGTSDRRNAVFETASPADVGDGAYWATYWEKANDPACKAAVLDMLLSIDLTGWNPGRDKPATKVARLQKLQSLSADLLWWRLVLESESWQQGRGPLPNESLLGPSATPAKTTVHKQYTDWHEMHSKPGSPVNSTHFWRGFRRWASEEFIPEIKPHGQPRQIKLRPFEEMRERFELWLDGNIKPEMD
jgi:hypothetical protein